MPAEIIDAASELEEMLREQAIAAHRIDRNAVSATRCAECDEKLPEARRKAYPGCTMCVDCANYVEMHSKIKGVAS